MLRVDGYPDDEACQVVRRIDHPDLANLVTRVGCTGKGPHRTHRSPAQLQLWCRNARGESNARDGAAGQPGTLHDGEGLMQQACRNEFACKCSSKWSWV